MRQLSVVLALALSTCLACSGGSSSSSASQTNTTSPGSTTPTPTPTPAPVVDTWSLRAEGQWIKDSQGRTVLLQGLNSSVTAKYAPYLSWQQASDYDVMPESGFNFVRMVLQWKAIEPQPGVYDQAHLTELERRLDWCEQRGLFVLLDFHQDAYSEKVGGNGAPDWATFDSFWPSFQMPQGLPWQAVYAQPKVIASFESFWDNKVVPQTGKTVQQHYADAWKHVALRFKDHPAVIGYDLMNEPYYGADIFKLVWETLLHSPQLLIPSAIQSLTGTSFQSAALQTISQPSALYSYLDALEAPVADFERNKLQPFMERCARSIREVDPDTLIFVEPSILVGIGIRSSLQPIKDASGQVMGNIVYAPHYYDPIAEALPYDGNIERARAAFQRLADTGRRLNVPVLIGEWGFLRTSLQGHRELAQHQQQLIDEFLFGHAYWDFHRKLTSQPFWTDLVRPRVWRVAGRPTHVSYQQSSKTLTLAFESNGAQGPCVIATPSSVYPNGVEINSTDPAGSWQSRVINNGQAIEITVDQNQRGHLFVVTAK